MRFNCAEPNTLDATTGASEMKLISVYRVKGADKILYELLKTRTPEDNISHKVMPTFSAHKRFVYSAPYEAWFLIQVDKEYVGSIYLTYQSEIGVFTFPQYESYRMPAVAEFMAGQPLGKPIHANVNPANKKKIAMLKKLGFKLIQHTYEKTA